MEKISIVRRSSPFYEPCSLLNSCGDNYVRGHTLRKLRTSENCIKVKNGTLQRFLKLPPELIWEAFGWLHPIDLMHLSRATKDLRSMILSRQAQPTWEKVYAAYAPEHHPWELEVCPPPDEISYPKWTSWMYDDNTRCDVSRCLVRPAAGTDISFLKICGDPGALLDIALAEHYCTSCKERHLNTMWWMDEFSSLPSVIKAYVLQMVPATYRKGWFSLVYSC